MKLGAFSISLAVKDLATSKAFYEKLGFSAMGGEMEHNYLIMTNGSAVIGLFQGMFEENILTFNPGWNSDATPFDPFDDVRDIAKSLSDQGIAFEQEPDPERKEGPNHFLIKDPDGNSILVDQHR